MNLLAIFAHPDDEVFSCGGSLARYAAEGHNVYLICATRGEEGEIIHPEIDAAKYPKGAPRGQLRTIELETTCKALGIKAPIFLDHDDSGFPIEVGLNNPKAFMNQDIFKVEKQLLAHIKVIKPEVMITFDPHGMYGHIDHITIHRAAIAAFWSAGGVMQPAPKRLFYPARTIQQVEAMKASSRSTTLDNLEPSIYGVSEDSLAATIAISDYAAQKREGIIAHRSQFGPLENIERMTKGRNSMFEQEAFMLGGLRGSFPAGILNDLFAGL